MAMSGRLKGAVNSATPSFWCTHNCSVANKILFHEVIAEFVVCLKVSSQNWAKYSMYEFSDSMYVVFCFNSWYPMKIVTIPIPYSKYRGTIIYMYMYFCTYIRIFIYIHIWIYMYLYTHHLPLGFGRDPIQGVWNVTSEHSFFTQPGRDDT